MLLLGSLDLHLWSLNENFSNIWKKLTAHPHHYLQCFASLESLVPPALPAQGCNPRFSVLWYPQHLLEQGHPSL